MADCTNGMQELSPTCPCCGAVMLRGNFVGSPLWHCAACGHEAWDETTQVIRSNATTAVGTVAGGSLVNHAK